MTIVVILLKKARSWFINAKGRCLFYQILLCMYLFERIIGRPYHADLKPRKWFKSILLGFSPCKNYSQNLHPIYFVSFALLRTRNYWFNFLLLTWLGLHISLPISTDHVEMLVDGNIKLFSVKSTMFLYSTICWASNLRPSYLVRLVVNKLTITALL